ncbi:MAG: VanW family protein [Clostridia bacterium]|nr:VanW family protein [Clostridia bacterium]
MEVKEKDTIIATKEEEKTLIVTNNYENRNHPDVLVIFGIFVFIFILIILISYCAFTLVNTKNDKVINNVYIKGIDVSGLTKEEAKEKISEYINSSVPEEIKLKHDDFETSISTDQLSIYFNVDEAVDIAYSLGKDGDIFQNNLAILKSQFLRTNIDPGFSIETEQLRNTLQDISSKLPDKVLESSYYIDGENLIITKGSTGCVIKIEETANHIEYNINNLNLQNTSLELITEQQSPTEIDLDSIYNEIHKEPVDSYYTQNPFCVYPSENGLDLAISLDEAKNLLQEEKSEYSIPLKVLYPNVTTNMIGTEAFPDLLSDFSTKYSASNTNRTTNLVLAANKINGTVLMPGETFSYNKVVGERTIAAGYKEAPIYVEGRVEDGLGGGICQITTTLYNAALYANLEIVERRNHQFVPSYANASRDATVVYGAVDFKFKNNREYPIKITCSVSNGIANFKIYGLKTENDYEVEITSRVTGTTKTAIYSEAYKTLKKNGTVVSSEVIAKDTYKRH